MWCTVADGRDNLRLRSGLGRLERWSRAAGQSDKNAAYQALFAVADGTVHRRYEVHDDLAGSHEFCVLVRRDLVIKVCLHGQEAFGIVYIGSHHHAPTP